MFEIFGRKLTIVEDNPNTCRKCALADICTFQRQLKNFVKYMKGE